MMKKRVLFLHPNFPAQFKHIAKGFSERDYEVKFLCRTHYNRSIKGVERICIKDKEIKPRNENWKEQSEYYRKAFISLQNMGWIPDIVISHTGWGCGHYVKEVWENCIFISYVEWWFDKLSDNYSYDTENKMLGMTKDLITKHWKRNMPIALELATSDIIVSPTNWQKDQLPKIFKDDCKVIYDGIDEKTYKINKLNCESPHILTYGTRGMEPIRAFPQFIYTLPKLLGQKKDLKVEIAGLDEINYGGNKPREFKTWGIWAKNYLRKHKIIDRVSFIGRIDKDKYITWLQKSSCHVYLTHPFVASWSYVEAQCCCTKIVASDVQPVREMTFSTNVRLVDHRDLKKLEETILKTLADPEKIDIVEKGLPENLKKKNCVEKWVKLTEINVAGHEVATLT